MEYLYSVEVAGINGVFTQAHKLRNRSVVVDDRYTGM